MFVASLACTPPGPAAEASTVTHAPAGPLRLPLDTAIGSLDPADASDAVSRRITSQIFDTLLEWEPQDPTKNDGGPGALRPEILAELPRVSADGLTWTLTLRRGPDARRFAADTCLEGQARPVRAGDVAASLLRIDPVRHAAYALLAGRIAGLDALHAAPPGSIPVGTIGIVADDTTGTVALRLTRPQPELPALLASPMLAIVPPECLAYYDGRDAEHPPFARHPVGSGPYVLDHARSELPTSVLLVRSPAAPASDRPLPLGCSQLPGAREVALTHFSDAEPALRAFQAGELALIAPGQSQFAEVVADATTMTMRPGATPEGTKLQRAATLSTDLLVFAMQDPDIGHSPDDEIDAKHRALRRAIALAFDAVRYQRIVRNDAWAVVRARIVPRGLGGAHDDEPLHRFAPPAANIERAKAILAAVGVTGPRTLRYWCGASEAEAQEASILRDALRPLDIDLEITRRVGYLAHAVGGRGPAQLFSLRFDADYLDAHNFLAPFTCAAPDNYSGHCDPDYDTAFAAFAALPPGPQRDLAAAQLERRLGDTVAVRPIDQPEAWYLVQPWLSGVSRHPLSGLRVELLCPHP